MRHITHFLCVLSRIRKCLQDNNLQQFTLPLNNLLSRITFTIGTISTRSDKIGFSITISTILSASTLAHPLLDVYWPLGVNEINRCSVFTGFHIVSDYRRRSYAIGSLNRHSRPVNTEHPEKIRCLNCTGGSLRFQPTKCLQ